MIKIEVTPAMMAAGAKRLAELEGKHVAYEHVAREVFEAMLTAAQEGNSNVL